MSKTRKMLSVFSVAAIAATMMAFSASAAVKGNLTFGHGENATAKTTYAYTSSTEKENSIGFSGKIVITGGEKAAGTYNIDYVIASENKDYGECIAEVGKSKGNSTFNYYVDGTRKHTSTAPWNFDFT